MKEVRVKFSIPTDYVGVEIYEEIDFEFDDDATEEEMREDIQNDFEFWLDDKLEGLRSWSEWEIL